MTTARGALKAIAPVPTATDFLDIVLSKTQRKTPTQIHKGFKISRIRSFYMRKVKFAQDAFHEKLDAILTEFPVLENLHPFLAALLNVLYDKNHYKLALGQLNTARHLIDNVGKDYARLLKFGDSLYRCKQLKRAGLGRMATIMRRQKDPLAYLEQVRQHMSRLPSIDPTTRTLLVCGYPNVGKSSFVNKVTRADVDVQPYAFTTKSLFVGHLDYKYLRWQVIDTPGVLDHPLDEMNTIEMQSITALAHLRAAVMYFMDLSEQCGYSIEAQAQLFHSIKPLFAGKPTFIIVNKIDVVRPDELDSERRAIIDGLLAEGNVQMLQLSCHSDEGVMDVRNQACEALLAHRIESKERTKRVESVANRLQVAVPQSRDEVERAPCIPAAVLARRKYDAADPNRVRLERDLEADNGGAGVYSSDIKRIYLLKDATWNHDIIPEVIDGKNVADFIDPDIALRLEELEKEEEMLEREGFYGDDEDIVDSDEDAIRTTAGLIRQRKVQIRADSQARKAKKQNVGALPRHHRAPPTVGEMANALRSVGLDPSRIEARAAVAAQAKHLKQVAKRRRADGDDTMAVDQDGGSWEGIEGDSMDIDGVAPSVAKRVRGATSIVPRGKRLPRSDRSTAGMRDQTQVERAKRLKFLAGREPARLARAGEADRHVPTKMPKHLFSGKRKAGKTNRR